MVLKVGAVRQILRLIESFSTIIILIFISFFIFYFRKQLIKFFISMNFLIASFFISLLASVSLFPIPYTYILFLVTSIYNLSPSFIVFLSIVSGLGSALGEAVAWFIGRISVKVLRNTQYFNRVDALLKLINMWGFKAVAFLVFLFSLTHLPDKVLYLPLGMMGYSLWRILPITFIGKTTMTLAILVAGKVVSKFFKEFLIENEVLVFGIMTALLVVAMAFTMFVRWDEILLKYLHSKDNAISEQ